MRARHQQPMINVVRGFSVIEGPQMIAYRDALVELSQVGACRLLSEFRLTNQDDLQQLTPFGFKIRQHANLLQDLGCEILSLINDENSVRPSRNSWMRKTLSRSIKALRVLRRPGCRSPR